MDGLAFVDTETTGLDPEVHEIWEVALIVEGEEHVYRLKPQRLQHAEPTALRITRLYERIAAAGATSFFTHTAQTAAWDIAKLTANRHLAGAVPEFDAIRLEKFLRAQGYAPAWHYQTIDVEVYAAGLLGLYPPFSSSEISAKLLINSDDPQFEKHTALGDARWAKAVWEAATR